MKLDLTHATRIGFSIAALAGTTAATAQEFTIVGYDVDVAEMSADGSVLVGSLFAGGSFYWTADEGLVVIGGGNGSPHISGDGSVIVGREFAASDGKEEAAIWLNDMNWQTLGNVPGGESCDNFRSSAWGTNADGSILVGLAWVPGCNAHAFVYDDVNGMVDLGSTVDGRSSRANGVSSDGNVIVGWQDASDGFRQGARWIEGEQTVFTFDDFPVGEAQGTNSDGSVIVGSNALQQGWVWTPDAGVQLTGVLSGFNYSGYNIDCTEDGSVIVGFSGFGFDRLAHVWTADTGCISASDYLTSQGVEVPENHFLTTATAITPDGRAIAGWGFDDQFRVFGWKATLPEPINLELAYDQLVAGESTRFQVTGAEPNQRIILCYSTTGLGETIVPEMNVTLDLDGARLAKMGRANEEGNAAFSRLIPSNLSGLEVWLQAAVNSATSEVLTQIIE